MLARNAGRLVGQPSSVRFLAHPEPLDDGWARLCGRLFYLSRPDGS